MSSPLGPRHHAVTLAALAAVLLLAGCLGVGGDEARPAQGSSNGTTADPSDGTTTGGHDDSETGNRTLDDAPGNGSHPDEPNATEDDHDPDPSLPANVTLDNGSLVERTNRSATFTHTGTIDQEPKASEAPDGDTMVDPPQATLTVPPDRWLKLEVTVTWNRSADHVVPQARSGGIEWCDPQGNFGPSGADHATASTSVTCTVRPDPRPAWEDWALAPIYINHAGVSFRETGYAMTVTVTVLDGPWSDLDPDPRPEDWPVPGEAAIRPGSKIGWGGCTANFVFRSPDNASLYVGTANHCVDEHGNGTLLAVGGVPDAGRLVHCSWGAMPENEGPGCGFPLGKDGDSWRRYHHDFALVEIRPSVRDQVHPAVRYWGGPTGLVHDLSDGDRVLAYGNTPLRDGNVRSAPDPPDSKRGHVTGQTDRWATFVDLTPSGVPGDSGGPALDGQGKALGHFQDAICSFSNNRDSTDPRNHGATTNSLANLAPALEALHERTDLEVELVTWPLLRQPRFPASPADPAPAPVGCVESSSGS